MFRSWEPNDTTSDSEPEPAQVAEKGSIEKTEKVCYFIHENIYITFILFFCVSYFQTNNSNFYSSEILKLELNFKKGV